MKFLIVSGGSLELGFLRDIVDGNSYDSIIAADSGMNALYKLGIIPDIIVGDFDSVDKEALTYFEAQSQIEFIRLIPEKDDTDTEHAIHTAIEKGADSITLVGATGTRLDHVLGNISLLGIGCENKIKIEIIDSHNRIRLFNESFIIKKKDQYGRFVSLIPYAGDVKGLTLKGMKYPLLDFHMGGFNSLGISNEIVDEAGEISFKEGYLLVIESKDA